MGENLSKLSNAFSTGGGGNTFERHVQALFLLALVVDGFSPILEAPVVEVTFQSKRLGVDTDDLLIIAERYGRQSKLFCQIKHDVAITKKNRVFQEVINAAWSDFQKETFDRAVDRIALMTGVIAKNSIDAMRYIHDHATKMMDERTFFNDIEQSNFTSDNIRKTMSVIRHCLETANNGACPSEKDIWEFCKCFLVSIFDLDYADSINKVLAETIIRFASTQNAQLVWSRLSDYAGECNQTGARITRESIQSDIAELFGLEKNQFPQTEPTMLFTPSDLWAKLVLVGSWNENNDHDKAVVEEITEMPYCDVEVQIREFITQNNPNIVLKDGIWKIRNKEQLVDECSGFYFDRSITIAFSKAAEVLKQRNNRFSEEGEYSYIVPAGGLYRNSEDLRNGLVSGLCMLVNFKPGLPNCSEKTLQNAKHGFIRDLFDGADWIIWASLYDLLPRVAEIAPECYLKMLEEIILTEPECMKKLFPKKNDHPMFSTNFISAVLWSLETLAWEERYLITCIRCLGELEELEYETTNYTNTPINTIVSILLPWHPQTLASTEKQKNAAQMLQKELPSTGWEVLKKLLPGAVRTTSSNVMPRYITEKLEVPVVTKQACGQIYAHYLSLAIELAGDNSQRLSDLVSYLSSMDDGTVTGFLNSIKDSEGWGDDQKYEVWVKLREKQSRLIYLHENKEEPTPSYYGLLNMVIQAMEPKDPRIKYKALYLAQNMFIGKKYGVEGWREREKEKIEAIDIINREYGDAAVISFAESVENIYDVSFKYGRIASREGIESIIERGCRKEVDSRFVAGMISGLVESEREKGILTVLFAHSLIYAEKILSLMYLTEKLYAEAESLESNQQVVFWRNIQIPSYFQLDDIAGVVERLLLNKRYNALVSMLGNLPNELPMSDNEICDVLYEMAITSDEDPVDTYAITRLIKGLQASASVDVNKLSDIEFIYISLLDQHSMTRPRALYTRIANDPEFFCELVEVFYKKRSDSEHKSIPKQLSERLFHVLYQFCVVPGTDWDGVFHEEIFTKWMKYVRAWSIENDRFEVTMLTVGNGFSYAPKDSSGMIHNAIVHELDAVNSKELREGFISGMLNQRGFHCVDPDGKEERDIAIRYDDMADSMESLGYSRFSETLREIANIYRKEADENIAQERKYREEDL